MAGMQSSLRLLSCMSLAIAAVSCGATNRANRAQGASAEASSGAGASSGEGGAPSTGAGGAPSSGSGLGGSSGALVLGSTGSGGPCAAYQSCADQGFNCGTATDGCGNELDCGTCTSPETCAGGGKPNVCGSPACQSKSCLEQGFNCGMATDGCGKVLDCGTCTTGMTCGSQQANQCGTGSCTPSNCVAEGFNCGMQGDGCGNLLDCGICPSGQVCGGGVNAKTGVCGTVACVSQSCGAQGFNCGMATDGCGNVIDCGTCTSPATCGGGGQSNVCGGTSGCPTGSELVYVWATNNIIYSFDPPTKTFTQVATPDCDASQPNSMAIDRNLTAWLNYLTPGASGDSIYKFDLTKGSGCTGSGIQVGSDYQQVGMGFSTDTAGGSTETLYLDSIDGAGLAYVDMTNLTVNPIGDFSNDPNLAGGSCELTGTGSALLYGYFTTSPYVRVAQLDKTNGNELSDTELQGFTPPEDWAFSFWGGDFYLYAYPNKSDSPNSSVIQYDPTTNALNLAYVADVGFTIIGAGVSTCAPTTPCVPKTCAQVNTACGAAGDGCGNILQCGACPSGEACVGGACTSGCTPKTCSEQGFSCGMQGDGCGNALSCGACPSGQSCAEGTCASGGCTPKSCSQLGYACGSVGDGCGNIQNCGTCPSGQVCGGATPGQCSQPACTPKNCAMQGFNCGDATDGCGNIINCGTCSNSQSCGGSGMANVCGGAS